MVISTGATSSLSAREVRFVEDSSVFPKPESGFYLFQNLAEPGDEVSRMRDRNLSLMWGRIDLEPYRNTDILPGPFLDRLENGFQAALAAGVKVIVRVSYGHEGPGGDYRSYEDPETAVLAAHMEQLGSVFELNADLIAFFEAGYVGPWGEWHTTDLANDVAERREIFLHILANTPKDRMVVLRYPALKQSIFESVDPLTAQQAYDGSPFARTGHHNDCFLSSPNDVGTYNREGLTMAEEMTYLQTDTLHTLFGGETCALHSRSLPDQAIAEMEQLHASYLNSGYHPEVLQRWRDDGAMETIEKRLGARFVLNSLILPDQGAAGEKVPMAFTLTNKGFASLYNERPVFLVLRDAAGNLVENYPLEEIDPRFWKPGVCTRFAVAVTLPEGLEPGNYSWFLKLSDPSERLSADPRFAVRLANKDLWDESTGEHRLVTAWEIAP